jgi:hypothetical protein
MRTNDGTCLWKHCLGRPQCPFGIIRDCFGSMHPSAYVRYSALATENQYVASFRDRPITIDFGLSGDFWSAPNRPS